MYIHYPGNSLGLRWTIYRGLSRITEDFESATLTCVLFSKDNKFPVEATVMSAADGGSYLYIELSPEFELPDGIYGVSAIWKKNEERSIARSMREGLFSVVNNQEEATDQGGAANIPVLKFHSSAGTFGYDGLSAYEMALLKGLTTKSETEWVQEQLDVATDQIFDAKDEAVGQAETAITNAKNAAVDQAEDAIETAKDAAVSAAETAIGESKENALDAIAEAIEGLEVHYTIETDKGTVKDVQLKDGHGNKLMPRTTTDNVTTQKGDTPVSVIDTIFDLNSKSMIQMDLTFMEIGTMSIKADGTYSKGAATSGFVRLKKSAMHLGAKSVIKIEPGAQFYIGGMYDDGTPVTTRSWILRNGGTYYIDKPGTFAVILRYVGTPQFDGNTYTAADLASHMTIVGNEIITETLGSINYMEKLSAMTPSEGITLNMDFLEIAGLQMANDGTANKYPQTVTRLCPISTYFYLHKGTIIRADAGAQMMIGGYMDDGTFFKPTTFQISGADGGAYHCAKNGHYYFVARFVGEQVINSEGYPQELLASKIHIIPPAIRKSKTDYSIRCIAHQGMSNNVSFSPYGNSRVSSYINAAVAGFTHGECDLQFTSDGVAVCCHDASFTDSVTGTTYVIANSTLDQLKEATYYGEKIATFDEVVAVCKSVGLGLYIDRVGEINTDDRWSHILGIIKKYNYGKKVRWLDFNTKIIEFDAESKFSLIPASNTVANVVSMLNNYSSQYPAAEFTANVNSTYATVANVQDINSQISGRTGVEVWIINNYKSYKDYLPYVSGITSDNYNEAMV